MATHSSILAWRIPWTEEPGKLPSIGSQRGRYDLGDLANRHTPSLLPLTHHPAICLFFQPLSRCSPLLQGLVHFPSTLNVLFSPSYLGKLSYFSNLERWITPLKSPVGSKPCGMTWTTHFSFTECKSCNLNLLLYDYSISTTTWKANSSDCVPSGKESAYQCRRGKRC